MRQSDILPADVLHWHTAKHSTWQQLSEIIISVQAPTFFFSECNSPSTFFPSLCSFLSSSDAPSCRVAPPLIFVFSQKGTQNSRAQYMAGSAAWDTSCTASCWIYSGGLERMGREEKAGEGDVRRENNAPCTNAIVLHEDVFYFINNI